MMKLFFHDAKELHLWAPFLLTPYCLEQKPFQRCNLSWKLNAQHCVLMWGIPPSMISVTITDVWPLPPSAQSFYLPLTVEKGLLNSFLHSSVVVSVMSLLGSEPLLQATMRHCLIYTRYFLVSVGYEGKRQLLLHGISNFE